MMKFFDDQEHASLEERQKRININLSEMVSLAYEKSSRIKKMCHDLKVDPSTLMTRTDFEMFPIISRAYLIECESAEPPFGGLQNPDAEMDRIFISPGPVYEPHLSEEDPLWARAYFAAGIGSKDVVLNAFSYHMVAAGLTFHNGLRRVGATVIPSGTSSSQIQVELIRDLNVTAYTGTPSFFMSIIKKAEEMGYDFRKDFRLRRACFAAEPLEPSLRTLFEKEYAVDTYQMYGATEVGDIAFECQEKNGWHICEEVLVEIISPATGRPVPPGVHGEIVVTRFNNIFFLFRFGTGDISRLIDAPCPCGRTSYRLDGLAGRIGDAVKVRGLFITPNQMRKLDEKFYNVRFQAIINRSAHEDILTLQVEPAQTPLDPSVLGQEIKNYFRNVCTVKIDQLTFLKPGTLKKDAPLIVDGRKWL